VREEAFVVLFRGVGGKTQLPTKPVRARRPRRRWQGSSSPV